MDLSIEKVGKPHKYMILSGSQFIPCIGMQLIFSRRSSSSKYIKAHVSSSSSRGDLLEEFPSSLLLLLPARTGRRMLQQEAPTLKQLIYRKYTDHNPASVRVDDLAGCLPGADYLLSDERHCVLKL